VLRELQGSLEEWRQLRVLNYEMEVATLLTVARVFGLRAGALCGVLVNRLQEENVSPEVVEKVEVRLAQVAGRTAELILDSLRGKDDVS